MTSCNRLAAGARLLAVALAAGGACRPKAPGFDEPAEMDHSAWRPAALESYVVYDGPSLALPSELEVVGQNLVILDLAADSAVIVVRRSDGRVVREFGRRGEGPGEFSAAWSIDPDPAASSAFWIFDAALLRLSRVDLGRIEEGAPPVERMVRLAAEATVLDPVWLDSTVVGLGLFESGRFAYFNAAGRLLRVVGSTPPGDDEIPATVRQYAYQSRLEPNASRTLLAIATRHADRLEVYRADGERIAAPPPPFGFLPRFGVRERGGQPVMATGQDLRFGYIDLTTTDDRIYALFSGRTRRGFPGVANFGEYIHVYDWSGRFLSVLRLDSDAIAIAVDPSGAALYALRHHPRPAVIRYALPAAGETIAAASGPGARP